MRLHLWFAFSVGALVLIGFAAVSYLTQEDALTPRQQRVHSLFRCIEALPESTHNQLVERTPFEANAASSIATLRAYINQVGDPAIELLEKALLELAPLGETACA